MDKEQAWEEAERRIAETKASGITKLDLSNLNLETLPPSISELTKLTTLDCSRDIFVQQGPLRDLGPVAALENLNTLRCQDNSIASLGPLAKLTALRDLDCRGNRIENVPQEITEQGNYGDDLRAYWDELSDHDKPNR